MTVNQNNQKANSNKPEGLWAQQKTPTFSSSIKDQVSQIKSSLASNFRGFVTFYLFRTSFKLFCLHGHLVSTTSKTDQLAELMQQ